jgi:energy-coupling factor transporter transmembrane protein EcfT
MNFIICEFWVKALLGIIGFITIGFLIAFFIYSKFYYSQSEIKPYLKVICTKDIKTLTEFEKDNFKDICLEGK